MEFRAIKRLLTVAECGSFSLAARALNVSQPALTRSIQQLEAAYGVELIERTSSGMRLTRIGLALEPMFREIMQGRERIKSEIKRHETVKRWQTSFGVCLSFEGLAMPMVLSELQQRSPLLDIQIHSGLTTDLIQKIKLGEMEFALGIRVSTSSHNTDGIVFEKATDDRLVVVASKNHPLSQRPHVSLADLSSTGWILPRLSNFTITALNEIFSLHGANYPKHVVTVESVVLAKGAVSCSQLVTVASELSVQKEVAAGEIAILNAPQFVAPIETGFFFRRGTVFSDLAAWSRDALRRGVIEASIRLKTNFSKAS